MHRSDAARARAARKSIKGANGPAAEHLARFGVEGAGPQKHRDVTIFKAERTTAEINGGLEQQAKLQARMDVLFAQRVQQGLKLTWLVQKVAQFAQDVVEVCPAAEQTAETAAASNRLAE